MNPQQATLIMQYVIGGLLAMIPLLAWGYLFYQKRKLRGSAKQVVISFMAGVFSVIPIFLVLGDLGSTEFSIAGVQIHGLHIYNHLEHLANNPGLLSLVTYVVVSIIAFLTIYVISAVLMFLLEVTAGGGTVVTFQRTLKKSLEEPFLVISLGILIGVLAYFFQWDLHDVFWKSMMIGVVEEFTKHLLVRFVNEDDFTSVADVIQYSILVALGFAFFENILYFVDKIWLRPCTSAEIQQGMCLFNEQTGFYVHQVGVLLAPFVFRSVFSTLAHVLFSGIFGYFYGLAQFATPQVKEVHEKRVYHPVRRLFHQIFHWRKDVRFHRRKIFEGAVIAMAFHGLFNFFLDEQVYQMYLKGWSVSPVFLIIPALLLGYWFVSTQLQKAENNVVFLAHKEKTPEMEVLPYVKE